MMQTVYPRSVESTVLHHELVAWPK